jgi:hypothetical protein
MSKQPLSESLLTRIWEQQCFRTECLHTIDGCAVQIICRGQRNFDNGPDFRQALIRIGEQVHAGDVELHLNITDWHAHGHDRDPAYNHTILHVCAVACSSFLPFRSLSPYHHGCRTIGSDCNCAGMSFKTSGQLTRSFQQIDLRKHTRIQRCQRTLHAIPLDIRLARLQQFGKARLEERVKRFATWLKHGSFEQVLYQAICEGLGYSTNKHPFLELARRLPLEYILRHLPSTDSGQLSDVSGRTTSALPWIQAMLFGASGLLISEKELSEKRMRNSISRDPETDATL